MEVTKSLICLVLIFSISACSNTPELETGKIKTVQLLKDALFKKNIKKTFVDARMLLSRQQIDAANIPVLFVELESGQNGTLTPYPGQGIGQTLLTMLGQRYLYLVPMLFGIWRVIILLLKVMKAMGV